MEITLQHEIAFWAKTTDDPDPESDCVLWSGRIKSTGYGVVMIEKREIMAAKVAWCLKTGQTIPSTDQIKRTCNNSLCVEISHLERKRGIYKKNGKSRTFYELRPHAGVRARYGGLDPVATGVLDGGKPDNVALHKAVSGAAFVHMAEAITHEITQLKVVSDVVVQSIPDLARMIRAKFDDLPKPLPSTTQVVTVDRWRVDIENINQQFLGIAKRVDQVSLSLDRLASSVERLRKAAPPPETSPANGAASKTASVALALASATPLSAQDDATHETIGVQADVSDESESTTPIADESGLRLHLARGFAEEMGTNVRELGYQDGETLMHVYDMVGGVQAFVRLLGDFKQATMGDETIKRTADAFARFASVKASQSS